MNFYSICIGFLLRLFLPPTYLKILFVGFNSFVFLENLHHSRFEISLRFYCKTIWIKFFLTLIYLRIINLNIIIYFLCNSIAFQ